MLHKMLKHSNTYLQISSQFVQLFYVRTDVCYFLLKIHLKYMLDEE